MIPIAGGISSEQFFPPRETHQSLTMEGFRANTGARCSFIRDFPERCR
jgi:hypothetical protein